MIAVLSIVSKAKGLDEFQSQEMAIAYLQPGANQFKLILDTFATMQLITFGIMRICLRASTVMKRAYGTIVPV